MPTLRKNSPPRALTSCLVAIAIAGTVAFGTAPVLADAAPNFGQPPSGSVPILYNNHHVYARPDILQQERVLAALVKDGTILVPLRSMFEQMGATVTFDPSSGSVTAKKPGASVQVMLGQHSVVINGTARPLDVPPMMYQGVLLVPVRFISEAMGAYVEWLPKRRLVVVRYVPVVPMTPPPSAPPTPIPTPAPTATPVPAAVPTPLGFVGAALTFGKNYNEFAAGQYCRNGSYVAAGAYAFDPSPFAVKFDWRQDEYVTTNNFTDSFGNQFTSFRTIDNGTDSIPVFLAKQDNLDGRLEYRFASPHIYVGVAYLETSTNYGYPQLRGVGVGLDKLPDFTSFISIYGSAFYYPNASGTYTVTQPASSNFNKSFRQQYQITKYDIGAALSAKRFPVYLFGGWSGDRYTAKSNAPVDQTHSAPYVGLGVKF